MKKLSVLIMTALICVTNMVAQQIPAGRDILPVVLDFAYDKEYFIESEIQVADVVNNEYLISGYGVKKMGVGYTRQDYTVQITRKDTELIITVSDMLSVGSDKDGVPLPTATQTGNTAKSTEKTRLAIQKDLSKRLNSWGDKEYRQKLNVALTSPVILSTIARQSALVFKKFISDNKIVGKATDFQIKVISVDKSPVDGFKNCITGQAFCGYKTGSGGIPKPEYVTVSVYTDKTTAEENYTVRGTIRDVKRADVGGLASIEVNE